MGLAAVIACSGNTMPQNKNQHFVPKTYLKRFSVPSTRNRAIHLVNLVNEQVAFGASLAGQCQRPYLHGKDPTLERQLGIIEGSYSLVISKLTRREELSRDDQHALRLFTFFQRSRTVAWAQRMNSSLRDTLQPILNGAPTSSWPPIPSTNETVLLGLSAAVKSLKYVDDLKFCVFENTTNIDLITSDNPVVLNNRWSHQSGEIQVIGYASSGLIVIMPVTPRILVAYFDSGVYSCPGDHSYRRRISNNRDIHALNELQVLNADRNVYFSKEESEPDVLPIISASREDRVSIWSRHTFLVEDPMGRDALIEGKRYRGVTAENLKPKQSYVASFSQVSPVPKRWFSLIRVKPRPRFFDTGTGAGIVRRIEHFRDRLQGRR